MNWIGMIAIVAIFGLLAIALVNGINGAILASGIAVIGGIGGYMAGRRRRKT